MRPITKNAPPAVLQTIYKLCDEGILSVGKNPYNKHIESHFRGAEGEDEPINTKKEVQEALADEQGWICCYCNQEIKKKHDLIVMKIEHYCPESLYIGQSVADIPDTHKQYLSPANTLSFLPDLRMQYSNFLCGCKDKHCDDGDKGKGGYELCQIKNPSTVAPADFGSTYEFFYTPQTGAMHSKKRCNNVITTDINCSCNASDKNAKRKCLNWELGGCFSKSENQEAFQQGILNLNEQDLRQARLKVWQLLQLYIAKKIGYIPSDIEAAEPNMSEILRFFKRNKAQAFEIAQQEIPRYKKCKSDKKFYPFCEFLIFCLENAFI
jgi:hypothetical protein